MVARDTRGTSTVVAVALLVLLTVVAVASVGVGTRTVTDDRAPDDDGGDVPTGTAFSYHTYGGGVVDVDEDRTPEFLDGETLVVTKDAGPPIAASRLFVQVRDATDPATGATVTITGRWDRLDDGVAPSYGNNSTVELHEGVAVDATDATEADRLSFAGASVTISYEQGGERRVLARLSIPGA